MRRSKTGSAPQARDESRGNFTPPARSAAGSVDVPEAPATSGSRFAMRNWRVPTRLNAILLIPVLVALVFGGFRVQHTIDTWNDAEDARHIAELVESAADYGQALLNERDRSAEPLLAGDRDNPQVQELRAATDQAKKRFDARAEEIPDKQGLKRRLAALRKAEPKLGPLRQAAYSDRLSGVQTEEAYTQVQHPLMELANELGLGTGNVTSYGRTVYAISLTKSAESLQRAIGMHLILEPGPSAAAKKKQLTAFASYAYLENVALAEYVSGGRPQDVELLESELRKVEQEGKEKAAAAKAEAESKDQPFVAPPPLKDMVTAISSGAGESALKEKGITPSTWFSTSTAKADAYRVVEKKLAGDAVRETEQIASDARRDTFINAGIVLTALLVAFLIAGMMARSMGRSMRTLRGAAFDVAQTRLPSLVDQLSRTEPGRVDTRVQPIPIDSRDEIGEIARAFDQVHREAVRLAAEQALLRGNVSAIFTNLSSRNQGLIERQLALVSELENNEADPEQLEHLFRMDHLATRMRRNGENLLVLAGEEPGRRWNQPVPLVDTLRAASSEVEHYERIELSGVPETEIHGAAVSDLVHLLAELLENATSFSSPQTKVRVTATRLPDGRVMIEIHDKGIGLTAEDFADINHKLANPPTVDAAISQRMGLFVVGRLANRHGIRVQLRPSGEQAGTTSLVMLPQAITRGGGGDEQPAEEDFTVSRIVPDQPSAPQPVFDRHLPSAADLGFDDSRYGPDGPSADPSALDPVGRSLQRDERRAALEAQQQDYGQGQAQPGGQGQQPVPYGYDPGQGGYQPGYEGQPGYDGRQGHDGQSGYENQPGYDGGQGYAPQPGYDPGGYSPEHTGQYAPVDGYQQPGYPPSDYAPEPSSYGAQQPVQPQAESAESVPDAARDRVGFDRLGPSPSSVRSTTGAGLPQRDRGRPQPEGGPDAPQQPQAESPLALPSRSSQASPAPQQDPQEGADPGWQSANDERWSRAGKLRKPEAGGVTESGLPLRVPKANLVEGTAEQNAQGGPQVSRAPEDVRGRLSNLHRGIRRGRTAGENTQNDRQGYGPGSTYDQER
ncbi:HAMP domain-containing protein [Streptomyces armeniacus]|uniref:histidine kinase n=1 Tax=Streptomyces armeniacus TaxID=83291 RepID=A0A345XYY1_9ACTN|nr:nitrate- and nitrite sensing domain-containing protein [Streptomyces armeniacus]AXK36847.1 HAMP domain-containing protein [Streptomyces armeniacus]